MKLACWTKFAGSNPNFSRADLVAATSKNIDWVADGSVPDPVAVVAVDFGAFSPWNIYMSSAIDYGKKIIPRWVTIDNYSNEVAITYAIGPLSFVVAPFTRKTFALPGISNQFTVSAASGQINVIVWSQLSQPPDDANLLSIQQTVAGSVSYPFTSAILVNTNQSTAQQNKRVIFAPSAGAISYTLLAASAVANGFESRSLFNFGSQNVSVTPIGTDKINGIWGAANPLILRPGDFIDDFGGDASAWYAHGKISYESNEIALAGGIIDSQNHNMGVVPIRAELLIRNKIANLGWTPGQELHVSWGAGQGAGAMNQQSSELQIDATQATFIYYGAGTYGYGSTLAAHTNIVLADWRFFYRLTHIF